MKQKIDGLTLRSLTVTILLFVLSLSGFGSGGDSTATPHTSGGDIHAPVEVKLVHGTLFVVQAVVNSSIYLDMLVDTGST